MQIPLKINAKARRTVGRGRTRLVSLCGAIALVLIVAGPLLIAAFIRVTLLIAGFVGLI